MSFIECAVLGLLNEGYKYGYELNKVLDERQMRYWNNVSKKSIYLALKRMTEKGWIEANKYKNENMPVQTRYTLTKEGNNKLQEMVSEGLASEEFVKFAYSIPIAFIYVLPKEEAIEQLSKRLNWLKDFISQIPNEQLDKDTDIPLGKRANIKLLRSHYGMEREWIEWIISELTT